MPRQTCFVACLLVFWFAPAMLFASDPGANPAVGLPLDSALGLLAPSGQVVVVESVPDDVQHDVVEDAESHGDTLLLRWAFQMHTMPSLIGMRAGRARAALAERFTVSAKATESWDQLSRAAFLRIITRGDTTKQVRRQAPEPGAVVGGLPALHLYFGTRVSLAAFIVPIVCILAVLLLIILAVVRMRSVPDRSVRLQRTAGGRTAAEQRVWSAADGPVQSKGGPSMQQSRPPSAPAAAEPPAASAPPPAGRTAELSILLSLQTELQTLATRVTEFESSASRLDHLAQKEELQVVARALATWAVDGTELRRRLDSVGAALSQLAEAVRRETQEYVRDLVQSELPRAAKTAVEQNPPPGLQELVGRLDAKHDKLDRRIDELSADVRGLAERATTTTAAQAPAAPPVDVNRIVEMTRVAVLSSLPRMSAAAATVPARPSVPSPAAELRRDGDKARADDKNTTLAWLIWFGQRAKGMQAALPTAGLPMQVSASEADGCVSLIADDAGSMYVVRTGDNLVVYVDPLGRGIATWSLCFDDAPPSGCDRSGLRLRLLAPAQCVAVAPGQFQLVSKGRLGVD